MMTMEPTMTQLELTGAGEAQITVEGVVTHVRYQNAESGYAVMTVDADPTMSDPQAHGSHVLVGMAPPAKAGLRVRGRGRLEDSKYGPQVRCETIVPVMPTSADGIETYLASGALPRVGPALARRIVAKFGADTFNVLSTDPMRLLSVEGLGQKTMEAMVEAWKVEQGVAPLMAFLEAHGASPGLAGVIVKRYRGQAIHVVSKQPYRLALEVPRVGFKTADTIARAIGIAADSPERAQAAALHTLAEMTGRGHCYATVDALANATSELLGPGGADTYDAISALATTRPATADEPARLAPVIIENIDTGNDIDGSPLTRIVFQRALYEAEVDLARRILDIMAHEGAPLGGAAEAIAKFEAESGKTLAPEQRAAVEAVATHKILVVTGGPGTGKSFVTKAILSVLEGAGVTTALASPTGRAAKRLSEATGRRASTIHRLLGMKEGGRGFMYDRKNPLSAAAIVVDEVSMVSVDLANNLFDALRTSARVVLVGDVDQLPSVGPGAILRDVIASGVVPTVRLSQIFRQAAGSQIIEAAAAVNRGDRPIGAKPGTGGEFFVFDQRESQAAADQVVRLATSSIPSKFKLDALHDIQVIVPMIKGTCGVVTLNERLQAALNPNGRGLVRGSMKFRAGDKVIHTKNNYDLDVYNGDIGYVRSVDPEGKSMVVDYDGRDVLYEKDDLDQITLAYAITCHRFQGSQAPCIVLALLREHFMLLSRNYLYTAITRAERLCVLVADPSAIVTALKETRRELRRTRLAHRLRYPD
jgi:exodeoxyribonuclease V alpha subunit